MWPLSLRRSSIPVHFPASKPKGEDLVRFLSTNESQRNLCKIPSGTHHITDASPAVNDSNALRGDPVVVADSSRPAPEHFVGGFAPISFVSSSPTALTWRGIPRSSTTASVPSSKRQRHFPPWDPACSSGSSGTVACSSATKYPSANAEDWTAPPNNWHIPSDSDASSDSDTASEWEAPSDWDAPADWNVPWRNVSGSQQPRA